MAAGNQVTLTFAGDSAQLEKSFANVGTAAKTMGDDVGKAGAGFDKADKAAGNFERAGRGLRDAFTGSQDAMKATGAIMRGDMSPETFLTAGAAVADLGGAFGDLIIPLGKAAAGFVTQKAAMVGHAIAAGAAKVATVAWTGVQWLLNAALTANPIGLIIVAIGLLIGIIVLIATKTTWFQDLWRVVWTFVKDKAVEVWDWLKSLPDKIGSTFARIRDFITAPFRWAFNFIADAWNNTIGKLKWSVPSWVPVVGGKTISAPQLPKFHTGGVVPGTPGQEVIARLQAGERVSPVGAGGNMVLEIRSSGREVDDLIALIIQRVVKARGGNVQVAFSRG
jgi:hypothetical protein